MNSSNFNILLLHYSNWLFQSLCRTHAWSARKPLLRSFIFCHNPLVITKALSATISKSERSSMALHHTLNCTRTFQLNLLPLRLKLAYKTCEMPKHKNWKVMMMVTVSVRSIDYTRYKTQLGWRLYFRSLIRKAKLSLKTFILWLITINHLYWFFSPLGL